MSPTLNNTLQHLTRPSRPGCSRTPLWAAMRHTPSLVALLLLALLLGCRSPFSSSEREIHSGAQASKGTSSPTTSNAPAPAAIPTMDINQAVMVTVELDFGPSVPTIAEALHEVERRHQPDDGAGRTFAILDAYGEPTPAGKLHMSMHVSSEKPGIGALVFRRTGEVLWQSRIVSTNAASKNFTGKNLLILLDNGRGKTFTVDGSANPVSILDAKIKEMGMPVRVFWPDGAEREMTCIYSACGCPVKVMVKREGERTARTKDLPVMFPDDPAVVTLISKVMQWQ
jgi:hypothetical protein